LADKTNEDSSEFSAAYHRTRPDDKPHNPTDDHDITLNLLLNQQKQRYIIKINIPEVTRNKTGIIVSYKGSIAQALSWINLRIR